MSTCTVVCHHMKYLLLTTCHRLIKFEEIALLIEPQFGDLKNCMCSPRDVNVTL